MLAMTKNPKQGSALLIVLGFLSFMVVSAVAFAIYMRTERLPSSALRRNVANRYLVKAALAQAMSRVDDAIRSDPFPGLCDTNNQQNSYHDLKNNAFDWWEGRVFMPPDPDGATQNGQSETRYAPAAETVSVLNLEALGYLPPALVNDVRFLSRSSWTAKWDYFDFDAGRYAFCAVNVSDFFDINRTLPVRRSSGAPVSLAQVTSAPDKLVPETSDAENFRKFLGWEMDPTTPGHLKNAGSDRASGNGMSDVPYVSMLDYNLALGDKYTQQGIGTQSRIFSPFWSWITGKRPSGMQTGYFYGRNQASESDANLAGAERQTFVTDSWYPKDLWMPQSILTLQNNQPCLPGADLQSTGKTLEYVMDQMDGSPFIRRLVLDSKLLHTEDYFSLWDYLDKDSVPLSLMIPCVERVPMIAALAPNVPVTITITPPSATGEVHEETETEQVRWFDYKIKVEISGASVGAAVVYPFKSTPDPASFSVQAAAGLAFVSGAAAGGGGGAASSDVVTLRNNAFGRLFKPLDSQDWDNGNPMAYGVKAKSAGDISRPDLANVLAFSLPSDGDKSVKAPTTVKDENDAYLEGGQLALQLRTPPNQEQVLFRKITRTPKTGGNDHAGGGVGGATKTTYQILLRPLDANGNPDPAYPEGEIEEAAFTALAANPINPYLMIWARVVDDNDKTVDLVPAAVSDDRNLNNVNNADFADSLLPAMGGGRPMPVMRFLGQSSGSISFATLLAAAPGSGPITLANQDWFADSVDGSKKSFYAVDPRFNWAPEDWVAMDDSSPTCEKWSREVFEGQLQLGGADRQGDLFFFVSNQGYLQSMGELAFLPRLSDMNPNGTACILREGAYDGVVRTEANKANIPSANAVWKSYQAFCTDPSAPELFGANVYRRGIVNGVPPSPVNPFTDNENIMLAALANTPVNYAVTGTNNQFNTKANMNLSESLDWAFNEKGANGYAKMKRKLGDQGLVKVARFLMHRFQDIARMVEVPANTTEDTMLAYNQIWQDMYDMLDWGGKTGATIQQVYDDLANYYGGDYAELNRFRKGTSASVQSGLAFHKDRALWLTREGGLSADPLRGQIEGDTGDTSFYADLDEVDRKMLYSFWRDCFANRQQLFLMFVRAESTALGGSGEGTPAQQGGRAVALVWRDPARPRTDYGDTGSDIVEDRNNQYTESDKHKVGENRPKKVRHPHAMRVLFYHQLD